MKLTKKMLLNLTGGGGGVAYGPEQTLTLQPDNTAGLDVYIDSSNSTTNYDFLDYFRVDSKSLADKGVRILIKFDVSSIPSNALIISAILTLVLKDVSGSNTLNLHEATTDWVESQATWNIAKTGTNWTAIGGDFSAEVVASQVFSESNFEQSVQSSVEAWVAGTRTNYGWLGKVLDEVSGNTNWRFHTSNHATETNRPKLEVVYKVPL